ncbi:MAG: tetratricopeptide repeat protein, partial [Jiangellaceae bacterium]
AGRIEMLIVAAGARRDLGEVDAAAVALQVPELRSRSREPWVARLRYAYADNLEAAGRVGEAQRWFLRAAEADPEGATDAEDRAHAIRVDEN